MGFGAEEIGDRWEQLREKLESEAQGFGDHPWIDEADVQSALMEAHASGIDSKLILSCREACANTGEFRQRLATLIQAERRPWRILAVDDEHGFLELLKLNLERTRRYKVEIQSKPGEVLNSIAEFDPDLVIMDIVMPETDGMELVARIREKKPASELPVIMLTALLDGGVAHAVTHDGLLHLSKPIGTKELLHCIDQHLSPEGQVPQAAS